jgi:hypothetical protein
MNPGDNRDSYYKNHIADIPDGTPDWTTFELSIKSEDGKSTRPHTFKNVNDSRKEEIIEAFNALDKSKREKLINDTTSTISFNN